MRSILAAALVLLGCEACGPKPVPVPPEPTGAGGSTGVGGATAAGAPGVAGAAGVAGLSSSAGCPAFIEPACASSGSVLSPERKAQLKRKLTGWKPSPDRLKSRRWRPTYSILPACSVFWAPNNKLPFDQRRGSCTANTVGGVLSTKPFAGKLTQDDVDERIYPLATLLDPFPKSWPPDDTGSDNASAWKAARQLGYTERLSIPIDSIEELQSAMQRASCMVGVDFYDSMFTPTRCGEMTIGGPVSGGHAMHVIGINLSTKKVWVRNSWSASWGLSRGDEIGGYAYFSFGTLQKLLNAGGELDCVVI